MIIERMLEFLCLQSILEKCTNEKKLEQLVSKELNYIDNNKIDIFRMINRRNKILTELIEPYVINPTSKE